MTYRQDFTLPSEILEQISEQGFEFLPGLIQLIVNAAMYAERQQYLQAVPYQRTTERRSYANSDADSASDSDRYAKRESNCHINTLRFCYTYS